jgi:CAAX prenyl protease-like protein
MVWPFSRAATARAAPFALFMLLLAVRGAVPEGNGYGIDPRWIYALSLVAVGGLMLRYARDYGELVRQLRPSASEAGIAVAVGLVVFALWIHLDADWMMLAKPTAAFTPVDASGAPIWSLIIVRWIGAALLVPIMEELFWRSFVMRWIRSPQFEAVPPARVGPKAVMLSTFIFMLAHTLWLGAIIAGLAYAVLYMWRGKLWVAIIAHAVTNGALGIWVVATGRWAFW